MQRLTQLTKTVLFKKHLFIVVLGSLLGFLISFYLVESETVEAVSFSSFQVVLSCLIGIVVAYLIYMCSLFLDKLLPWRKYVEARLFIGIITLFSLSYLLIFGAIYVFDYTMNDSLNFMAIFQPMLIKLAIIVFILILIFEIIYFALYSYYSYTTLQIETVKQERKQIELQLNALKSQLSPHFLFNSLNTISSLVYKEKKRAQQFIRKLANMYQYTLQSYSEKLITLQEELDFVKDYLFLLETRFENKLTCTITVSEELLDSKVPPLAVQMLVENAVKHNQKDEYEPLHITITSTKKHIIVQNNITEKATNVTSFNIGLKNINSRYLLLHTEGITISNGENFSVKLPLI
ncbi:histidine kinase [Flavobacteriaceae bacterium S356]|uniref:Histidine kinase n=1 Tax=Asprobacillus argus TaxID=3076534 RepID=A0ABU3LEH3_9FLAO|nr:histidine kinase [Flavobacteriaceae bacterium S356]